MTKTKKLLFAIVAIVVLIVALAVVRVASYAPVGEVRAVARRGELGYAWRGAIHVHSRASDGAAGIDEIMAAAGAAGLDFVILSDHNPFASQRPRSGWFGDVLLIVAEEISTEQGHLLALGTPPRRYRLGPTARQALADIDDEGGWALVSHPDHAWQAWRGGWGGTEGIEIVNLAAAWSRQTRPAAAVMLAASLVDPDFAVTMLLRGDWPAMRAWDALVGLDSQAEIVPRRRVAVGAADAHGPVVGPVPSYADTLSVLNTLIWIDESPRDARGDDAERIEAELLGALRDGRAAVQVTALGDAREFAFMAASPSTAARMGDFAAWELGPWRLRAVLDSPAAAEMVLLRDGEELLPAKGAPIDTDIDTPGTYRVAVYRSDVSDARGRGPAWLISNPIYVWPSAARTAARVLRLPPLPAPPLSRDLLAEATFEGNERGVARNLVRPLSGVTVWEPALEQESEGDAFAAITWRPPRPMDWSGAEGIVVGLRALRPLRVNLEVRAFDLLGEVESWTYSVKATPEGPATAIPWDRFRPPWAEGSSDESNADPRRPQVDDLKSVRELFFIVTPAILAPGSTAELHLEVLGLYGEG